MNQTPASTQKSIADRLQETRENLFFIVGSGRCGSTVLRAIFDAHPMTAVPSETLWFGTFEYVNKRSFDRADDKRAKGLSLIMEDPRVAAVALDEKLLDAAVPENPTWEDLFVAVLTVYRESRGRQRAGEKTPYHIHRLEYLAKAFPQAKFIHIIRDPRAVVASYVSAAHYIRANGRNPIRAIEKWAYAYDAHSNIQNVLGADRYIMLTYESLVSNPQPELDRLCEFLNLPFDEQMLSFSEHAEMGFLRDANNREGLKRDLNTDSLEKWRKKLSHKHIQLIEHHCQKGMAALGYEPAFHRTPKMVAIEGALLALTANTRDFARSIRRTFVKASPSS